MEADDSIESECNALQDRPISEADYNARESLGVPLFQVLTNKFYTVSNLFLVQAKGQSQTPKSTGQRESGKSTASTKLLSL